MAVTMKNAIPKAQINNQSGTMEYNSGVQLPLQTQKSLNTSNLKFST
jgi:hypothetical protein